MYYNYFRSKKIRCFFFSNELFSELIINYEISSSSYIKSNPHNSLWIDSVFVLCVEDTTTNILGGIYSKSNDSLSKSYLNTVPYLDKEIVEYSNVIKDINDSSGLNSDKRIVSDSSLFRSVPFHLSILFIYFIESAEYNNIMEKSFASFIKTKKSRRNIFRFKKTKEIIIGF